MAQQDWMLLPLAAAISALLAWLLIPLALRLGWVDRPSPRKVHETVTPLTGGVAVFLGWAAPWLLYPRLGTPPDGFHLLLPLGCLAMLITGLVDDVRSLSSLLRLMLQVLVCLLMVRFSGVYLGDLGQLFSSGTLSLGMMAVPVTAFAALGVINAFNLIDGMDGLAGTIFCIAAAGMAMLAASGGQDAMLWLLLLALASVLGFMVLNARWPWNDRARVFLGDAGSLMLGFFLAWCFIKLGSGPHAAFMPMTAVWLFAVPLLDTSTLIWMRWRSGQSALSADLRHLHHAFLRAGFSVGETWMAISMLAAMLATVGFLFEFSGLPEYFSFYSFMAFALVYYFYLRHAWASQRFLGRHFIHHDFLTEEPCFQDLGRHGPK